MDDPYVLALTTYALELGGSGRAAAAREALMALAIEDENGLHWSAGAAGPLTQEPGGIAPG